METELQAKLRLLLPQLLQKLHLDNVRRVVMYMEADGGLENHESEKVKSSSTSQDAINELYSFTRSRGDPSIVILAKALRNIKMDDLADKLEPDVTRHTTGASASGSGSDDRAATAVNKASGNLLQNLLETSPIISKKLTEAECEDIIANLYAKKHITEREKERLKKETGAIDKASALLDIIEKKTDDVIRFFVMLLRTNINRSDLATLVEQGGTGGR